MALSTKTDKIDSLEKLIAWGRDTLGWDQFHVNWVQHSNAENPNFWWELREEIRRSLHDRVAPIWLNEVENEKCKKGPKLWAFLSDEDATKVVYTPDAAYGAQDRQIITTVGRLLKKLDYPDGRIRDIVDRHRAEYVDAAVHFAFDASDTAIAYETGPGSCMSKKQWGDEAPYRIYDGPDAVIACLMDSTSRITARAVCNISQVPMVYTRIYGDAAVLASRLQRLGFVEGNMNGARVRRQAAKSSSSHLIMPYIDTSDIAVDDGEFVYIGYRAKDKKGGHDISARGAEGLTPTTFPASKVTAKNTGDNPSKARVAIEDEEEELEY